MLGDLGRFCPDANDHPAAGASEPARGLRQFFPLGSRQTQRFGHHGHHDAVSAGVVEPGDFFFQRGEVNGFIRVIGCLKNRQDAA
jgi:hypothetical protein